MTANTVHGLLALAGVDDIQPFNGKTHTQRLAQDLFDNSFLLCMDKLYEEIDSNLKSYSTLTVVQGQI